MKERIIAIFLLLLAGLTVWAIAAELPRKDYARPAAEFTDAVRSGTISSAAIPSHTDGGSSGSPAVANEVIRLHILADNDSNRDQTMKLALRDVLLPYLNAATLGAESKEDALTMLTAQCSSLTEIANAFLAKQNAGYTASVSVDRVYFPIRIYGSQTYLSEDAVIFPPGFYDSVQVVLGSGKGHNWWCLAYPSLCFIDSAYDYVPKDSDLYKLKIGTVKKGTLEKLFYGDELHEIFSEDYRTIEEDSNKATNSDEITIYFGSKLWELLKNFFE